MNRRIKTAWISSITMMFFIFCGQAYWLYNQYAYNRQMNVNKVKEACKKALKEEQAIRNNADNGNKEDKEQREKGSDTEAAKIRQVTRIAFITDRKDSTHIGQKIKTSIKYLLPGKSYAIYTKGIDINGSVELTNRYLSAQKKQLSKAVLDSLLEAAGMGPTKNFYLYKTKRVMLEPVFSVEGNINRQINVRYSSNPLEFEAVSFDIAIPIWQVLHSMAWLFAANIVFFILLCLCLLYQVNTIMIQKRIDGIRREFMKNMIYEMKQPPATEPTESEAVKIGDTSFYYSTNELHHGSEKVIITSRQAEILRLLAMNVNGTVSRETLLNEIWGDDSYANSMALNVQITYLRRVLKTDNSISIRSVIKKGYVLKVTENSGSDIPENRQ